MAIRNLEWYDLNEGRSWPIADQATMIDDEGVRMPGNLLVDMNVWFPETVGEFAFVSAITVGPKIATVTFLSTADGHPPIGAVSVNSPIDAYRHYPVESLYPGVGGWVVFGSGLLEGATRHHRFSNPGQSLLIPHVARKYKQMPIPYVGKHGVKTVLDGIVRLRGGEDIEVVKEVREIEEVVRDVIVIRLASSDDAEAQSVLQKYFGPCGGRPESRTCGDPPPIEVINSVEPDCCGNITLEFKGCADVSIVDNEPCSIIVDCGFGLSAACISTDRLPDEEGTLPNEYEDLCSSVSIISGPEELEAEPADIPYAPMSPLPTELLPTLPLVEDFSGDDLVLAVAAGQFDIVPDSWPSIFGRRSWRTGKHGTAMATFRDAARVSDWSSLYRRVTTHMALTTKSIRRNGGLLINFRDRVDRPGSKEYWMLQLDQSGDFTGRKGVRVSHFDGDRFSTLSNRPILQLAPGIQYRLTARIFPAPGNSAWLLAEVHSELPAGDPLFVHEVIGPVLLPEYRPATGQFGIFTFDSQTEFNRVRIDNEVP